jgi:hypothetical protein
MRFWKKSIITLVPLIGVFCGFASRAEAQASSNTELINFTCFPSTCKDIDFGLTSFADVRVSGTCGDPFNPASDYPIFLEISVAAVDCSFLVETETEGKGQNQTLLDDCGRPYQLGQISVLAQVFNALTTARLYAEGASEDCAGGETIPPPAFSGC